MSVRREWARKQARAADEALLVNRLTALGGESRVAVHENETVLVSVAKNGMLRVHRGFAYAPDGVLAAVLAFVNPKTPAHKRRNAERRIKHFSVDEYVRPARRRRRSVKIRPGDRKLIATLRRIHQQLNDERFGGELSSIKFRISHRMRRRLGELTVDPETDRAVEIAISARHLRRDDWHEVEHTVLHEMVHQWQAESGLDIDHGATFRLKAVEVGVLPRADRLIASDRGMGMDWTSKETMHAV